MTSTPQVRKNNIEEQTNSFLLKYDRLIYVFEEMQKSIQDVIGDVYCPICPREKCI